MAVTVPVLEVAPATPRSRLLVADFGGSPFDFLPGHAVLIGQPNRRPYSIASSPERAHESGQLELLVATEPDGELGAHLPSLSASTLCFVCGPRAMVAESVTVLRMLGVPDAAIRTEGWGTG